MPKEKTPVTPVELLARVVTLLSHDPLSPEGGVGILEIYPGNSTSEVVAVVESGTDRFRLSITIEGE